MTIEQESKNAAKAAPWTYERIWDALAEMRLRKAARVVLFGTSTTAQQNGYSQALSAHFQRAWGAECLVRGFGGMALSLAGLARLPQVIEDGPQLVLLDFTTGPITPDFNVLVDRLTTELVKADILPVWVAYPIFRPDGGHDEARSASIRSVRRYCETVGVPFVDAFHTFQTCEPRLFRDRVHPTEDGAAEIADFVWSKLARLLRRGPGRAYDPARLPRMGLPRRGVDVQADLAFTPVEALELDGLDRDEQGYLVVPSGAELEIVVAGAVHSAEMRIGPYSPILDIHLEDGSSRELELWDEWCHFERPMLIPLAHLLMSYGLTIARTFRISFSARRPDYGRARRPMDGAGVQQLVKLKGFHHQGAILRVRLRAG